MNLIWWILLLLFFILTVTLLVYYFCFYKTSTEVTIGEDYENIRNLPQILILVISDFSKERWVEEKKLWNEQIQKKYPNIHIHFTECVEHFTLLKENCKESLRPGIYQKTLLSLQRFEKYDFYVRTNLSTFFIFDHLMQMLSELPLQIAFYAGRTCNWGGVRGAGIIFNKKARDLLLNIGFEKKYFEDNETPDDVLISKLFQRQKVLLLKHVDKNALHIWNYGKSKHWNLLQIRRKKIPMLRMKNQKNPELQLSIMKKLLECFKILYIKNAVGFHYEILESVLLKYSFILQTNLSYPIIYMDVKHNESFKNYFHKKYAFVQFGKPPADYYDFFIDCSFYSKKSDYKKQDGKHFYISHHCNKQDLLKKNIYFLTPLAKTRYLSMDILPFPDKRRMNRTIPVFLIQGNLESTKRDYSLLVSILSHETQFAYQIKIIGKSDKLPSFLQPYQNKIILKANLNFEDYHKEVLDCYCLVNLTSRDVTPKYYINTLTSVMNYAKAYNLYTILDKEMQNIYKLQNVFVYEKDITDAFENSLEYFYHNLHLK